MDVSGDEVASVLVDAYSCGADVGAVGGLLLTFWACGWEKPGGATI